jgi:hypothetical protein
MQLGTNTMLATVKMHQEAEAMLASSDSKAAGASGNNTPVLNAAELFTDLQLPETVITPAADLATAAASEPAVLEELATADGMRAELEEFRAAEAEEEAELGLARAVEPPLNCSSWVEAVNLAAGGFCDLLEVDLVNPGYRECIQDWRIPVAPRAADYDPTHLAMQHLAQQQYQLLAGPQQQQQQQHQELLLLTQQQCAAAMVEQQAAMMGPMLHMQHASAPTLQMQVPMSAAAAPSHINQHPPNQRRADGRVVGPVG